MRKRTVGDEAAGEPTANPSSTLARGFALLRAFRAGDRFLGNMELAQRVDLPKATVSRLTQTLADLGYLKYLSTIGKYELTPAVLSLGYSFLSRAEINTLARPMMEDLASECGCSVALGVRDQLDMVVIEQARGRYTTDLMSTAVGRRIPVALAAMGWACAYQFSAVQQAAFFDKMDEEYKDKAPKFSARMLKAFDEIHERGFCLGIGEFSPAYNSVGVPLPSLSGGEPLALNLAGPSYFLPQEDLETKWGPKLLVIARHLRGDYDLPHDG